MSALISPSPFLQFVDANGNPLTGGKLFTYAAGSTSKQTTFTSASAATPNTNPVILDTLGSCEVWLPPGSAFKYVLSPATDTDPPTNPIKTIDNITGSGGGGALSSGQTITLTGQTINSGASVIYVNVTATGPATVLMPPSPILYETHRISPIKGDEATNPITISGNGHTFAISDGNTVTSRGTYEINLAGQTVVMEWNGTQWSIA